MKGTHFASSKTIGKWSTEESDYIKRENRNTTRLLTSKPGEWKIRKSKQPNLIICSLRISIASFKTATKASLWKNRACKSSYLRAPTKSNKANRHGKRTISKTNANGRRWTWITCLWPTALN